MTMVPHQEFFDGRVTLYCGDCLVVLSTMPDDSVDAIMTDPPYGLEFMGKEWDAPWRVSSALFGDRDTPIKLRQMRAFQHWCEAWARECLRVLKPGGFMLAFGGSRTSHRMVCGVEEAGFEIRDMIGWLYGQGFPKSPLVLKPALEPVCMARKPLVGSLDDNVARYGTGLLNIDGCRIAGEKPDTTRGAGGQNGMYSPIGAQGRILDDGNGRWPANLIHDGSEEVLAAFPDAPGQQRPTGPQFERRAQNIYGEFASVTAHEPRGDSGSAGRFFYTAKADADDRLGSKHPTIKPVDLIRYFSRLVTPAGGILLDPFAGTGTTGEAAWHEGFVAILIEREAEYQADTARRMDLILHPSRRSAVARSKNKLRGAEGTPLFPGEAESEAGQ